MRQVAVIGAGMTRFGKHVDRSMKDLAREAVEHALRSAGVEKDAVEAATVGNA
ncbi:MAG: thiolase family protein, partial [Deltaproteobacteria bacterium]|nr:thiolase family protein [Deltaproteobacteria bacterium]